MNFFWFGSVLAAVLIIGGSRADDCNRTSIGGVVVTNHSDRVSAFSTFSLVWIVVSAKTPQGGQLDFYVPYMSEDQFIPPAKSVCKIMFHTGFTSGSSSIGPVPQDRKLNIVDEISCNTGRFLVK